MRKPLDPEKVLKLFPTNKPPREIQVKAVHDICSIYNNPEKDFVLCEMPVGCHAKGTLILTAYGHLKRVEDITEGDLVMGWDGTTRQVRALHRGRQTMFRITPTKGGAFEVNLDHVLTLIRTPTDAAYAGRKTRKDCKHGEVIDVTVREWLTWSTNRKRTYKLFRRGVEAFRGETSQEELPIDPYVLGLMLGDGALTTGANVCKTDDELEQPLREEAAMHIGVKLVRREDRTYAFATSGGRTNPITKWLKQWELDVTSEKKSVPKLYLRAHINARRAMLAGLLDTDGSLSNNVFDFISASRQLAEDVTFLARSLGLAAYMTETQKSCQNNFTGIYWRVCISGELTQLPMRIKRKIPTARKQKKDVRSTAFSVEQLPSNDYYGFQIEGDGRYLMGDFTVTHNSGKSLVARAFGLATGNNAYYLTLTQQLQEQYTEEFGVDGFTPLLGRAKFPCHIAPTCADGKHVSCGAAETGSCAYVNAKVAALQAPHVVANYHSFWFNVSATAQRVKKTRDGCEPMPVNRKLLVIDEAHAVEAFLLDQVGLTVKLDKLAALVGRVLPLLPNELESPEPYFEYIKKNIQPAVADYIKTWEKRGTIDPKTREELENLLGKCGYVLSKRDERWVPEREEDQQTRRLKPGFFSLKPLYVQNIAPRMYALGEFRIFMSGTILDAHTYCKALGLDTARGAVFTYDSPFKRENRLVYAGTLDLSFKKRAENWPEMASKVEAALNYHPNQKGLLLCPSNKMLDYIANGDRRIDGGAWKGLSPKNRERLIRAAGEDRSAEYRRHISAAGPTVLAASGYWEGANLEGEASRFQIIPQVPRPMWSGQTKARAEADAKWYSWMTYTKMLQGLGRSVRGPDDYAVTYVFDKDFTAEVRKGDNGMIPLWVRSAVVLPPKAKEG